MIGYLSGTIIALQEKNIIIDVGGVGYKVFITPSLLTQITIGMPIALFIYTAVREDTLDLFGFENSVTQEIFELLITISGIGPKSALGILSVADLGSLVHAIKTENLAYLTQVSGIGKKTAEKIIIELKDKVEKLSIDLSPIETPYMQDVTDALLSMGYHERIIRQTLRSIDYQEKSTSEIIREALQLLGK